MIASVSRAFAILELLSSSKEGIALSAIVAETNIEKSTAFRIVETLERDGYIKRDLSGNFRIALKFVSLALLHLEASGFSSLCVPILQELADATQELAQLAIAEGDCIRFVAKADGKGRVQVMPRLGTCAPLHATAVGKVWLASLPEATAARLLSKAGLERLAPNTITSVTRLNDELRKIRWTGYAINNEETFVGVKGIAVPVLGERDGGQVIGAVTIVAPAFRMSQKRTVSFYPALKRAAEQLRCIECLLPPIAARIPPRSPALKSAHSDGS